MNRITELKSSSVFALTSLMALASGHSALVVSVNLRENNANQEIAPATMAGGGAGVGASNWNDAAGGTGSVNDLVDDDGIVTTADLTWSSGGTWGDGTANADADLGVGNAQLQRGYLDDNQGNPVQLIQISLSDIPYDNYDLVVYFSTDTGGDTYGEITVTDGSGATTASTTGTKELWGTSPFLDDTNSLRVSGLTGDLTIDAPSRIGGTRHSVSGLQIIGSPIPEPSSAGLLTLSSLLLLGRRKR